MSTRRSSSIPGNGWNRIQLQVDDLAKQVQSLREAGLHFRNDIVAGQGGKQILLDDPAGNAIELFEPPRRDRCSQQHPIRPPTNFRIVLRFRSRAVTRALTEIVIVVVGILIAFALDAGWDAHTSSVREEAHLRALASDFQQNSERLGTLIRLEERVSASSGELLAMAQRERASPRDSVMELLGPVFNSGRYEPVMGAYEALVNSGGLTLIRDDSLRAALAEFAARVNGRYAERFSDELYFAFIREFAGQLRFFDQGPTDARNSSAYEPLLRNPRFQEYLAFRSLSERDLARRYRELLLRSDWIVARIRPLLD